ncbi:hypothetical protein [Stakelama tenebrarum]|uniref:Uncharacterized protein n=1 Tax=Stakelama tenebrarum TaxID=2711215 RepID=A0A6G6Y565_9SPHN|nr:hypothetical protein [Sphingosinithalassobacter tenebrarum]QIG79716.1 hypothetical protein G5C33_07850 [Sphingosinithalassobacter tenebrarum]
MSCLPVPSLPPSAQPLTGYDPYSIVLHSVLAKEILEIRETLEGLAEVLVSDAHFAANYLEQLQSFDYVIQHAEECASLMNRIADGEDSREAIGHVRLGAVQDRLRRALGG